MTYAVIRYRCDLCGSLHILRGAAEVCEAMCEDAEAQAIEARRAATAKTDAVHESSVGGNADAPKGEA